MRALPFVLAAAAVTAVVAFLLRGGASERGQWAAETPAPTPAFSGLSIAHARELAADEGRLLLIDFTAEWCGPCKRMEATTWRDQRVIDWITQHAVAVQIDVDRTKEVAVAFEVAAMPTVVVERAGQTLDRSQGYLSADGLLRWLDGVASGETFVAADLGSRVRYTRVPDRGSSNAYARLSGARTAVEEGRFEAAVADVEWLWAHGAEQQRSFEMARWAALPPLMTTLVEKHPPARDVFLELLETAQAEVDSDRVGLGPWLDWLSLCKITGEDARIEAWYRAHCDEDGSIDEGRYWRCFWIHDGLFESFVEQKRYADAGRVYRSPAGRLERQNEMVEMVAGMASESGGSAAAVAVAFAFSGGDRRDALREQAASISAALVAAGREAEAVEIGEMLLAQINDGPSRKALVSKALDWARPLPQHVRWYAEAVELGADVADLEPKLEAAQSR